jgi:hypothetical protein
MFYFREIRAKLDRAETNLNALDEEIRNFVKEDRGSAVIVDSYDAIDQPHSAIFKERIQIPHGEWGMALGAVVDDLRGVLDYVVTALVVDAGREVHAEHQFPIVGSKQEWKARVVKPPLKSPPRLGYLDFIDETQVADIKALQPYKSASGLPSLLMLRRFSEFKRHQIIHSARVFVDPQPRVEAVAVFPVALKAVTYPNPLTALEDATEVARYSPDLIRLVDDLKSGDLTASDAHVNVHVDFNTTVLFGEPGREDVSIDDFRGCLTDIRERVVDHFERLLSRSPAGEGLNPAP